MLAQEMKAMIVDRRTWFLDNHCQFPFHWAISRPFPKRRFDYLTPSLLHASLSLSLSIFTSNFIFWFNFCLTDEKLLPPAAIFTIRRNEYTTIKNEDAFHVYSFALRDQIRSSQRVGKPKQSQRQTNWMWTFILNDRFNKLIKWRNCTRASTRSHTNNSSISYLWVSDKNNNNINNNETFQYVLCAAQFGRSAENVPHSFVRRFSS